jgi:hypothetical protein
MEFTKASGDVIPEYIAKDITMREGAEMWEVLDNGTKVGCCFERPALDTAGG